MVLIRWLVYLTFKSPHVTGEREVVEKVMVNGWEGEWSCYRGGQFREGEWSYYGGGQFNGGTMIMLQRWIV